jgi:hypothetical protein
VWLVCSWASGRGSGQVHIVFQHSQIKPSAEEGKKKKKTFFSRPLLRGGYSF